MRDRPKSSGSRLVGLSRGHYEAALATSRAAEVLAMAAGKEART